MDTIYYQSPKKKQGKRIFSSILLLLLLGGFAYGGFFMHKIFTVSKKINMDPQSDSSFVQTVRSLATENTKDLESSSEGRINVLLLGIAGKGKPGQFLTDTIIIASIDKKTDRVAMLSIPRDLFVSIPDTRYQGKINTIYQLGLKDKEKNGDGKIGPLLSVMKEISGLDMDYYAVLNFDGFQRAIDDIGGINIVNERDIFDARYPGPNYSYETFELKKGFHHLDGATALKYARERHNDPQGDFGRAKRQQQVMQAAKNKIFSAATLFNPVALNSLLDTLGDNIVTDISPDELGGFLELAKKLDTQNITNVVLDAWNKDSLLKVTHVQTDSGPMFALVPRVGNWSEVQELARNIFDLDALKRKRAEIAKEDASVAIVNKSGNNLVLGRIKNLLSENLDYKNVVITNSSDKNLSDPSTVYDLTNGAKPFTANELVTKLPAKISYDSGKAPALNTLNGKFDLIVVIGKDLIDKYNMEEGTLEDLNSERDNQESIEFNKN